MVFSSSEPAGFALALHLLLVAALWGLVPRPDSAVSGGLPLTSSDLRNFHAHGPLMRIDDLSAFGRRVVARVSASVAPVDNRLGLNPRDVLDLNTRDVLDLMHGRSQLTIGTSISAMPGRSMSGFTDQADTACAKREAP